MRLATPDVGAFSFYLDDPARGQHWERFVAERFVAALRARFDGGGAAAPVGLVGISMGGYGALKMAFARPSQFAAVAAVSPMIEPFSDDGDAPLRNRWHYPDAVPQALLGPERDRALVVRDHPAARARRAAAALRAARLAIYVDAAGDDALNAHDGAEHLHRVLWQHDVAHEYRLRCDADHVGPEIVARLREAFAWTGARLSAPPPAEPSALERAWSAFIAGGLRGAPPAEPLPPASPVFPRLLRAQLAPLREAALRRDPSLARRYGVLPEP